MRFQVLGSTVSYSHSIDSSRGAIHLSFSVFPWKSGELKFSDGNRLVARDLSEKWGEPLTMGDLYGKTAYDDRDVLNDGGKCPISATVILTTNDINKFSYYDKENGSVYFLRNEEFACGYAHYNFSEYRGNELLICVCIKSDVLADLLRAISNSPSEMFLDVEIRGLEDEPRVYWPGDFEGAWNLDDASDCGKGDYRVVTGFHFERTTSNFPSRRESERLQKERAEDRQMLAKLNAKLSELVAIENDGANTVVKLLLLNLFAVLAIVAIGILALVALYF